jgi:hypothetical protein
MQHVLIGCILIGLISWLIWESVRTPTYKDAVWAKETKNAAVLLWWQGYAPTFLGGGTEMDYSSPF